MQISALCSKYDELEPGAPPFEERLEMMRTLSKNCKRVIVRAQPYIHDIYDDMVENIPRFAEAGVHGIIFEGMKFVKKKPGLVKCGGDYVQKKSVLQHDYARLKNRCHENGLAFYCGENRLRAMGDSLTCCGVADLEGFRPNVFNLNHLVNGDNVSPTEIQKKPHTACVFHSCFQDTAMNRFIGKQSFAQAMMYMWNNRRDTIESVLKGD